VGVEKLSSRLIDKQKLILINECICGCQEFSPCKGRNRVPTMMCARCGIMIQIVDMDPDQLRSYYRDVYHQKVYTHLFQHDLEVARDRVKAYGPSLQGRVLDVGCGNGAFVSVCRDRGLDAEGQDLSHPSIDPDGEWTHQGDLIDLAFPTDFYDSITCHDVLEHTPDPRRFLQEIRRMMKPSGRFMLDFPDFMFDHHWKMTEHLWMLTKNQVIKLLRDCGFLVRYFAQPVEGKFTFYCNKDREIRKSVLLPPGIGDSYWSIVKLPGLMKEWGETEVNLFVSDPDNRQRSLPWIRKIPWGSAKGYVHHATSSQTFQEAYMRNGRYLFQKVEGCDYFLAFNGVMRFGADLDQVEESWGSEWFPKLHVSTQERTAEREYKAAFGKYAVAYFVEHGMYKRWLSQMKPLDITGVLNRIKDAGFKIVFMGAEWDKDGLPSILAAGCGGIDLCGETTIDQMFGLIRGSCGVIGFPAGNTIMSTVLKVPTFLFWNQYFDKRFWGFSCPPQSRGEWYHWMETGQDLKKPIDQWLGRL